MSDLYADCGKISNTISSLESLNNSIQDTPSMIEEDINSIKNVGNRHDNCFSSISSSSMISEMESVSKQITSLSSDASSVIHSVVEYSCGDSSKKSMSLFGQKISSVKVDGLAQGIIADLNSTTGSELSTKFKRESITEGYDYQKYNNVLKQIQDSATTQREKITATAIFMATYFPQLPYFWGGGHYSDVEGVDPSWGSLKQVTADGHYTTGTNQPYSVDCSGFVNWVLYNSGYDKTKANSNMIDTDLMQTVDGITESLTAENVFERVQPGDIAHMDGHIGMVVKVDGTEVTMAHSSGSGNGMELTTIDTVSGVSKDGTTYSAGSVVADSNKADRMFKPYFTEVREAIYEGE